MRLPVMGANWKLHKNQAGTESFFEAFRSLVKDFGYCEIVICPAFLDIPNRSQRLRTNYDPYWHTKSLLGDRGRFYRGSFRPNDQGIRLLACDRRT